MDERDYEILLALYSTKNITRAAEKLYVSQPSLTYRIKQVEKEVGHPVILRGTKGIEFTNEGELLIKYIKKQQKSYAELISSLQNEDTEISGVLKIGASGTYARYTLPAVLANFHQHFPKVDIKLITGWSSEINKLVISEQVHLGIIRGDYNPTGNRILLNRDRLYIVSKEKIELSDLSNLPAISYATDNSLKNTIEQWWNNNFKKPQKISMHTDRFDTCYEIVLKGLGYAILPEVCIRDQELYLIPLLNNKNEPIYRDTWLAYSDYIQKLKQVSKFIKYIADEN